MSDHVYGGFWRRLIAQFLDGLIVLIPFDIIILRSQGSQNNPEMVGLMFTLVASFIYTMGFICSPVQATPAKRLMGLFVANTEGRGVNPLRALIRYLVFYGIPVGLVSAMFLFTEPTPIISPQDDARIVREMSAEAIAQQPMTPEQKDFVMKLAESATQLSPQQTQRVMYILDKNEIGQPLALDDIFAIQWLRYVMLGTPESKLYLGGLLLYCMLQIFCIALTHRKTGLHDLLSGTRVMRGSA